MGIAVRLAAWWPSEVLIFTGRGSLCVLRPPLTSFCCCFPIHFKAVPEEGEACACVAGFTSVPQRSQLPFAGLSRHRLNNKASLPEDCSRRRRISMPSCVSSLYIKTYVGKILDYALFSYTYKYIHTCFGQCEQGKQYPQLLLACELCIHRT